MQKTTVALLGLMALGTALAGPSVFPTGVTVYDPSKAYNEYVAFGGADRKTHLIDMDGNEVHSWAYAGQPSVVLKPELANGRRGEVLVQLSEVSDQAGKNSGTSLNPGERLLHGNQTIGELDWNGKTVWQWGSQAPDAAARQHHDIARLANGNTLILANWIHTVPGFKAAKLFDDVIYEVTPAGDIIWKWVASEHLNEFGFSKQSLRLVRQSDLPDYLHLNDMTPLGPNHWFDAGDARFDPNNILIDSREANFIVIIDRKTGHIVWRIGPDEPSAVEHPSTTVPRPVDQTSGQHDAHLIPPGLPGAGNLLVFDNQGEAGYPAARLAVLPGSRILEINPVTKQIVWQYTGADSNGPPWSFYSAFISSVQRLPNGNTLIDEGMNGRFFQITPNKEIVWEYVSPYFAQVPLFGSKALSNFVYRAEGVPYDWIPEGTTHAEKAVTRPDEATFHVSP